MELASGFTIRKIANEKWESWNRFVLQQRDGTLFHTTYWLKHQPKGILEIYGLFDGDELVGGIPCLIRNRFGFSWLALPIMTPYSGPVLKDSLLLSAHRTYVIELFVKFFEQFHSIRFKCTSQASETTSDLSKRFQPILKRTSILYSVEEAELWNRYTSAIRGNIRKAEKNGVIVQPTQDFGMIHSLSTESFAHSGRKHPFKKEQFIKLATELNNLGLSKGFIAMDRDGQPVAASWVPRDRNFVYNIIHGLNRQAKDVQAGPLVLHYAILDCMKDQLNFDFEGSMQDRIHRFYAKYSAKEETVSELHYIYSANLRRLAKLRLARP